ncbi:MAG: AtpZ/AtpI family protein [bacterium]|nr:AtpZ/AtpI family protein [bacterium]
MFKIKEKIPNNKITADYASVGLMFPVAIVVGLAMGYFLDKWLNTSPYMLIIMTLYGIAAGFRNLIKVTKPKPKEDGKKN